MSSWRWTLIISQKVLIDTAIFLLFHHTFGGGSPHRFHPPQHAFCEVLFCPEAASARRLTAAGSFRLHINLQTYSVGLFH
jgi:hypothetical protein